MNNWNRRYFAALGVVVVLSLLAFGLRDAGGIFVITSESLACEAALAASPNLEHVRTVDKTVQYEIVGRAGSMWRWDRGKVVAEVREIAGGNKVVIQF